MTRVKSFLRDESGAAVVEYSVILAFLAATLVLGLATLGSKIASTITQLAAAFP